MQNLIIGSGYAGSVIARILAEKGETCHIIERRSNIAGNMYDYKNKHGLLVHKYGPHIPVMNTDKAYNFLSRFTEWLPYEHHVNAEINGKEVPLPINFTSIDILYPEKSNLIKCALINEFGEGNAIPILDVKNSDNLLIKQFADDIYEKVFLHYTMKMWDLTPNEIDPSVTARIPIRLSYDDRHFMHKYQVMPKEGYTKLFEHLLDHPNIKISLNTNACDVLEVNLEKRSLYYNGLIYRGNVYYTGALDELLNFQHGELPYRSLHFELEDHFIDNIQSTAVLNWPDSRPETRRTEMKILTLQDKIKNVTTTLTEYPGAYKQDSRFMEPYYPIIEKESIYKHSLYLNSVADISNFIPVGRLADYKYYNMEATILRVFSLLNYEV